MEELRYCSFTSHHINIPAVDLYLLMFKSFFVGCSSQELVCSFLLPSYSPDRFDILLFCYLLFPPPQEKEER